MSAESEKNSANPSELQVLQGINKKMFLTPARIGLTSSQLSCEANWGAGQERFQILVDEDIVKVSLNMCSYGGRGKRKQTAKKSNNSRKIRTISRMKPLLVFFFIFVSRTIQSYLDCILLEYSSLS